MEENNERRWYISNGTCSWFNQLHVLEGVHEQGTPENSWDNSIWFNNKQDAEDFNEQLQNFINKNYFEKKNHNTMKKLLTLCLALIATTALWASNTITYNSTKRLTGYNSSLIVGKTTFGSAITSHKFADGKGTITCESDITTIGERAFSECTGLTSVTIPNSVTTIGERAFSSCTGLTTVTIPNSVTTIRKYAFAGCSSLTSVSISNSVETIESCSFSGCCGLTSVTIPNSVTKIGTFAFYYVNNIEYNGTATGSPWGAKCVNGYVDGCLVYADASKKILKGCSDTVTGRITIPNSVTTIDDYAFYDCNGLTSIDIPISVTTIDHQAFYNCTNIKSVIWNAKNCNTWNFGSQVESFVFGECVEEVPSSLCSGMNLLTSITIPKSVTTIGSSAFYGCSGLTSVTIPNSVTTIGESAFYGCSGLTSVTIPNSVTTIESSAFSSCRGLTSITIPNSVTTIGSSAFSSCRGLTSVTIPNSVTTIGDSAFFYCSKLTSVTIPNSVTTIGDYTFSNCYDLTSVTIPNSVTTIGSSAFSRCDKLEGVYITDLAAWCIICFYDSYSNPLCYAHKLYLDNQLIKKLTIPNSVTTIGNYAFYGCSGLTSVSIPNSVTTIGKYAFSGCESLYSLTSYAIIPPTCGTSCFKSIVNSILVYVPARSLNAYKDANVWKTFTNIQGNPDDYAVIRCSTKNGTVSGAGTYIKGDKCTLKVTPNYGYHFTQWNDNNKDNPRTIIVTKDSTFKAQIEISQFKLIVNPSDDTMGYVSGSGMFDFQSQHNIFATANYGYHFIQWNDGNTENPRKLILTKDTTFIAEFAPNNYQVSVQSSNLDMGYANGSGSYVYQSRQSISATANYGYHFTQWNDDNTDNPRTIQVLSDTTFTAEFAKNIYTISVETEHGSVAGGGDYEYLSTVQLTATADEHYHFTQWSDGNTDNPRTITIEEDKTYTAIFSIDQHTISAYAEYGKVIGMGSYDYGTEATLTVIPDFGYEFASWSDSSTDNPRTVFVTGDVTYNCICTQMTAGKCGDNLYWEYKEGKLIITGTGEMYDYAINEMPWYLYRDNIQYVEFSADLTYIGCYAFANFIHIEEITCFANQSPRVCSTTFDGLSKQYIYLYVPADYVRSYQVNPSWNEFDIRAIDESGWQDIRSGINASKYFHNGNLIIERNGIKYTATGQKVR